MKIRNYSVKINLETYASIYVDYEGSERSEPLPMTLKQANFIAKQIGGFVVKLDKFAE